MNHAWASCKGPHCADPVMGQNSVSTAGPNMGRQHRARTVCPQLAQTWLASTGPEHCVHNWPRHGWPEQGQNNVPIIGPDMGHQHRARTLCPQLAHTFASTGPKTSILIHPSIIQQSNGALHVHFTLKHQTH